MPSPVSETDAFPATIQRPNNGELADSASIAQFADGFGKRTRYLYNRSTPTFDATRAPYSADATGAADATTAIQNALNAASTAGGGIVDLPPGTYLTQLLSIPRNVWLRGTPGATWIAHNHATLNVLSLQASFGTPARISDISFIGNIASTGTCVPIPVGARVVFERCNWNGNDSGNAPTSNLQGKLALVSSASAEGTFIDCGLSVAGTLKGLHATAGKIRVSRGKMVMPATYSESLAYVETTGRITLDGVYVDLNSHVTGVAQVLYSATNDATAFAAMRGCEIEGASALGTLTAFYWSPDARVAMMGNNISLGVAPFGQFSAPYSRSVVELREYVQQDFSTSASIDLRNTYGYRTHLVRNDDSSVSIILPAGVMDGQELDFIYYNAGVSAIAPTFATTQLTGTVVPTIAAGNTLTGHFRWVKREASGDSDRWVQVGTWGVGATLV